MRLVVGATGLLGSEICQLLADEAKPWKALVRQMSDPSKREALKRLGAEIAVGDLKDRSSLDAACQGVSAVISTASSTLSRQEGDTLASVDLQGQINLIDAARAAGVEQFIFISFRHEANPDLEYPLKDAKRTVEEHLKRSGLEYTILRAGYFMEIWLSPALGFDYTEAKARIYGTGENALSWVAVPDVAQFAVACLDNPASRHSVIEVGGPEALSPLAVVRLFEQVFGRTFSVEHVPVEALQAQKQAASDPLQESFAALMLNYASGDAIDMGETLQTFPVRLASVRDYAARVADDSAS